ncbi:unnamed protein product [Allacma fusca]|uniref:Uncharacterized protein n=1 Tax=Allacma fusca TaxID=39272 RepID=A0A8J2JQY3_9HEXA|nr:unnamed protein product [Allacma fusca]
MQNQQEQEHSHVNNNSEKVSEDSQVQSVSQELDKTSTPNNTLISEGFSEDFLTPDVSNDEELKRRSWNTYSDASISPKETSSSSCSHIHQSGLKGSQYCHYSRRKQSGSTWADEDESTGALGDAESSDQAPSSTEEIGTQIKLKKKRSINIFGSFGKSGADGNPAVQRRSHFFLDSVPNDSDSNGDLRNDPDTNGSTSKTHSIERTSALFSSMSSGGSYLLTPTEPTETDISRSSMSTITPEVPENLPNQFDEILDDLTPSQRKSFFVAREILMSERTFVDFGDITHANYREIGHLHFKIIGKTCFNKGSSPVPQSFRLLTWIASDALDLIS